MWCQLPGKVWGHKGHMDAVQVLDVHVEAATIEQACEVVAGLYMHEQARTPLVVYIKTFYGVRLYSMCCGVCQQQ